MSLVKTIGLGPIMIARDFLEKNCPLEKKPALKICEEDYSAVDVEGDLVLSATWKPSENGWRFNRVKGNMICSHSKVDHMSGFPRIVEGDFDISFSQIKSLQGCPNEVWGNFICTGLGFTEQDIQSCCKVGKNIYC